MLRCISYGLLPLQAPVVEPFRMTLTLPEIPSIKVPEILKKHGLRPDKRLGQVFLCDLASLRKVIEAAEITPEATILEIGAGIGNLTRYLAALAAEVFAVEKDLRLLPVLKEELRPWKNVTILEGDILHINPDKWLHGNGYLVVANIPYYITSAILRHLLSRTNKPARIVLTIQKEVAERVCALPGEMSLLALSVQIYGQVRICGRIPAGAFFPAPEVDSAVLRVDLLEDAIIPDSDQDIFFQLAKAAFSQKRKTLRNALAGGLHLQPLEIADLLQSAMIDPQRRAESLSLEEWRMLVYEYRQRNAS